MRGLSLVGLLVGLGVVGILVFHQTKPAPETGASSPTEAVDKANAAATTIQNQAEQLQQDLNQQQ